ncbi:MAG: hypothetical protein J6V93_01320 [Clostridia bacterium]|nr:hypothetical protein [Clostridia bacterium]
MKKNFRDLILNLIIALLAFSMIVLLLTYAGRKADRESSESNVFDKLWIIGDYDESAFSALNASLCTPELIAYKQPGSQPGALYADEETISTVYSVLSDTVLDVFGADSVCISDNIDAKALANELANAQSYILYEYSADIPFPYIYALATGESSVDVSSRADGKAAYISKLALILSEGEDNSVYYSPVAFDSNGGAYRFEKKDKTPYVLPGSDIIHLYAYASSFERVKFYANTQNGSLSTEIIHPGITYAPLSASPSSAFLELDNDIIKTAFLELFELNPEKLNSFVERDGTTVFIGTAERLSVAPDGIIEFESNNEPMPLNSILGYTPGKNNSYTLFDMLKATDLLISRFRSAYPEYIGKNASIKLTGVYKGDGEYTDSPIFEYSYFYEGMRIDTEPAFRFVFTSTGVSAIRINSLGFAPLAQRRSTLSKSTVFDRIALRFSDDISVRPIYTLSENGVYELEWAAYVS